MNWAAELFQMKECRAGYRGDTDNIGWWLRCFRPEMSRTDDTIKFSIDPFVQQMNFYVNESRALKGEEPY